MNLFQASSGQLVFLDSLDQFILLKLARRNTRKSDFYTVTIEKIRTCSVEEVSPNSLEPVHHFQLLERNKYRYLRHLPSSTVIHLCQIDLRRSIPRYLIEECKLELIRAGRYPEIGPDVSQGNDDLEGTELKELGVVDEDEKLKVDPVDEWPGLEGRDRISARTDLTAPNFGKVMDPHSRRVDVSNASDFPELDK